jgi:transposase-like protein
MSNLNEQNVKTDYEKEMEKEVGREYLKCPHCGSESYTKKGKTTKVFKYLCSKCNEKFTSVVNTTAMNERLLFIKFVDEK